MRKDAAKQEILSYKEFLPYFSSTGADTAADAAGQLGKALELCTDKEEIDRLMLQACEKEGTADIDPDCARLIIDRYYAICGGDIRPLSVHFCPSATQVRIPDPSLDEIEVDLTFETGADIDELLAFMAKCGFIEEKDIDAVRTNWKKPGFSINPTDKEKEALNKCLKMGVEDAVPTPILLTYNTNDDNNIWRREDFRVKLPVKMSYKKYPFDEQSFRLKIGPSEPFDVSTLVLKTDCGEDSLDWQEKVIPPRGFLRKKCAVSVVSEFCEGYFPTYNVKMDFVFTRKADTFFWRTFLPLIAIVFLATIAAGFALSGFFVESVMTNLLPATLIASVALQLVAAQNVPKSSGRTREDLLFILVYLTIILYYLSLLASPARFAQLLFAASLAILAVSFSAFIYGARPRRTARNGKPKQAA